MDREKAGRLLRLYRFRSSQLRDELKETEDEEKRKMIEEEIEIFRHMSKIPRGILHPRNNSRQTKHNRR